MVVLPHESSPCIDMSVLHYHRVWPDAVPVHRSSWKPGETMSWPAYPHLQPTTSDHLVQRLTGSLPSYGNDIEIYTTQAHGLRDTPWVEQARPRRASSTAMGRGTPSRSASQARLLLLTMWSRVWQRPGGRLECTAGTSPGKLGLRWLLVSLPWQCFLDSVLARGR